MRSWAERFLSSKGFSGDFGQSVLILCARYSHRVFSSLFQSLGSGIIFRDGRTSSSVLHIPVTLSLARTKLQTFSSYYFVGGKSLEYPATVMGLSAIAFPSVSTSKLVFDVDTRYMTFNLQPCKLFNRAFYYIWATGPNRKGTGRGFFHGNKRRKK